jgi:hypothetical protein
MIRRTTRALLIAGGSLIALPAAAQSVTAEAQAVQTEAGEAVTEPAVDDVVVIARRREERLIDVPVAVTALGAQDLVRAQAVDLSGVQGTVPNVNLVQGRGSSSNANIFIRGIGQPDALQTFDPGHRHLCRRGVYQPHPGRAVQPVRRRAAGGAARAAGNALRQEHDRRRGQRRQPQAGHERAARERRGDLWPL